MKIEDYQDDEVIKPEKKIIIKTKDEVIKPEKKIINKKIDYEPIEPSDNDIEYPENKPPIVGRLGPTEEEIIERRKKIDKLRKELPVDEPIIYTKSGEFKKVSDLTLHEQEDEIIKCKINPIYFICTYLTIFDQTQGDGGLIVPFKLFQIQIDLINDYINHRFVIPNKYRQAGISTATCAYIAWYIMFNKNRSVAIVANKQTMAEDELMKDVVDFIDGCPTWLRPKTGKIENFDKNGKRTGKDLKDTQSLKIYDNGSKLAAFSSKGLRGYTPTLLYWDEVAWTEKNDVFWTATRPTLQTGGAAILVSCVTKDTYLYTNKGIKQIKDFIPNEELGAHVIDNYSILGKDKVREGNLFFNNGYVDTLKIKSTYSELESSYNHKYWAYKVKNKKYDWYKASELEIDDCISIQYGMNIWGDNDDCSDFNPTESPYIQNKFNPKTITSDIAYLLGLYLSEGWAADIYRNNKIKTTKFTLTCGDSLAHVFENNNLNYNLSDIHYTTNSLNLGEFLKYLGFDLTKKAPKKIIPSRLLEMSRENIIAMIQGIMDGDGYACYLEKGNSLTVGITLSSKELIDQIRIILSNFGIITRYTERIIKPTKKVKAQSYGYTITAMGNYSIKYFEEIGFRFNRKQIIKDNFNLNIIKCFGKNNDTIPNGGEILYNLYDKIKEKNIFKTLLENNINIEPFVTEKKYKNKAINRFNLLKLIEYINENTENNVDLNNIINPNIIWTKVKSITQSKNFTYDFSLPNNTPEINDFHHSVVYNQILTHQTPNGLDTVYYKTFEEARKGKNNFHAVELWWFNDPRYNKELAWYKNKKQTNEIKLDDNNFSFEKRLQLKSDGWEASSPWLEEQIKDANGDIRKIRQELLCVSFDSKITIIHKETKKIESLEICELYNRLKETELSSAISNLLDYPSLQLNGEYQILNNSNTFVDFSGIDKSDKSKGLKIILENDAYITVSEDHLFVAGSKNIHANSLVPNVSYLTTVIGDLFVKNIETVDDCEFYDIVNSDECEYFANNILNHNCSFLGSGDNFIAEEYLKRIEENDIQTPVRQEYIDLNMWIFEDPIAGEEYIIGVDASPGHGDDNSTVNILKKREIIEEKIILKNGKEKKQKIKRFEVEQVAEYYGKLPPDQLADMVYQYGKAYNDGYVIVDVTGGYGIQSVTKLMEFGYQNFHYAEVTHKPTRDQLSGYIKKGQRRSTDGNSATVDLVPGFFIGNNRASVLLELQRSIHLKLLTIRSIRTLTELKTFVTVPGNRVADHKRSFHDDSIMGLSIGLFVINYEMVRGNRTKSFDEKMLNAFLTSNDINGHNKEQGTYKPKYNINPNHPLNPYITNSWLFYGMKPK